MSLYHISENQLLAINAPECLFTDANSTLIDSEYRLLAKRFHPDHGGSTNTFQHLSGLYKLAKEKVFRGEWITPGRLEYVSTDGKRYRMSFYHDLADGLARCYIGQQTVVYALPLSAGDLAHKASDLIDGLRYPSTAIETQTKDSFPSPMLMFQNATNIFVVQRSKPRGAFLLRDVLAHFKGRMDSRYAAWIISRLYHVACYLEWAGLTHNDISTETVFIDPAKHTVNLLGGWWYAVRNGARMARLQQARTVNSMPAAVLKTKLASSRTDLELIKTTGLELLGLPRGGLCPATVPAPMFAWLQYPSGDSARDDYRRWHECLTASFGERRFIKLELTYENLYGKD